MATALTSQPEWMSYSSARAGASAMALRLHEPMGGIGDLAARWRMIFELHPAAIRGAMSKSDLPEATKLRIRWLHAGPIEEISQAVLTQFAWKEIRWSDKRDPITCVKGYALRETDMSFDQADELKERLDDYVIERRPLSYLFPST
jgi:hypothetical protein